MSAVAKDLGINRQQFARYINGTSIPRASLIDQIAQYFDVEPGELFQSPGRGAEDLAKSLQGLHHYASILDPNISEDELASGFYLGYRASLLTPGKFFLSLAMIYRDDGLTKYKSRVPYAFQKSSGIYVPGSYWSATIYKSNDHLVSFLREFPGPSICLHVYTMDSVTSRDYLPGMNVAVGHTSRYVPRAGLCCLVRQDPDVSPLTLARQQGFFDNEQAPDRVKQYLGISDPQPQNVLEVR